MEQTIFEQVYKEIFSFWEDISDDDRNFICQNSFSVTYSKGTHIHDGEECSGVIFLCSDRKSVV